MKGKKSEIVSRVSDVLQRVTDHDRLVEAIAELVEREVAAERQRAVDLCRGRAELWRRTLAAHSPIAGAREEARARANEAAFVADALETELPLSHYDNEATN